MNIKKLFIFMTLTVALPVLAENGMVIKQSDHSVDQTVANMKAVLEKKGINVVAELEHEKNASRVGLEMQEATVLLFGNPKMGTPLMKSSITVGIDLPMKLLVWKDADGKVWMGYNDPAYLASRHGITDQPEVLKKMTGALGKLTDIAAH